eukprot:761961-Hanusia_phi.AAC.10
MLSLSWSDLLGYPPPLSSDAGTLTRVEQAEQSGQRLVWREANRVRKQCLLLRAQVREAVAVADVLTALQDSKDMEAKRAEQEAVERRV